MYFIYFMAFVVDNLYFLPFLSFNLHSLYLRVPPITYLQTVRIASRTKHGSDLGYDLGTIYITD